MSEPVWVPLGAYNVPVPQGTMVTSLPGSPIDGQEIVLVDSLTIPSYAWQLRYIAGITDGGRWVFIGGSPLFAQNSSQVNIGISGFVELAGGPEVTLPRAGIYIVSIGFRHFAWTGSEPVMSFTDGTLAADDSRAAHGVGQNISPGQNGSGSYQGIAVLTSGRLRAMYRNAGGQQTFANRYISALPVRLA